MLGACRAFFVGACAADAAHFLLPPPLRGCPQGHAVSASLRRVPPGRRIAPPSRHAPDGASALRASNPVLRSADILHSVHVEAFWCTTVAQNRIWYTTGPSGVRHATAGQASLTYLSTLAVLQLDAILTNAWLVKEVHTKEDSKNQRSFERMLIMEYICTGVGRVKMTVGVRRKDKMKVQYCITAIDADKIKQEAK